MKLKFLAIAFLALQALSCAGSKSDVDPAEALDDALISFSVNAQAGKYTEALNYLTYEDQLALIESNGDVKEAYCMAMSRVKISALRKETLSLDAEGRIQGMKIVLERANQRFQLTDQQRNMSLDKLEKHSTTPTPAKAEISSSSSAVPQATDPLIEQIERDHVNNANP